MKILNLGSLNIDRTYTVEAFVQPKETIHAVNYEEFCGGKGLNQSVAAAKAGADVYHAGAVGADGNMLINMLEKSGVKTDYLLRLAGASGHAVIQLDKSGQNNIIICGGANRRIEKEYIDNVLVNFNEGDILLLQNEISNVEYAMEAAKARGLKIIYNPAPMDENVWKCNLELVDCFVVNEIEGRLLAEIESDEPILIIEALRNKFPKASFVLTLGENGAYYFNCDMTIFQDICKVDTVDTTGAGDTFCGYFVAGIAEGLTAEENLQRASKASAIGVGRKGAAQSIPTLKEIETFRV